MAMKPQSPTAWTSSAKNRIAAINAGCLAALYAMLFCAGCIMVPLPLNRVDPATRRNVQMNTGQMFRAGVTSREEVIFKLGEPEVIAGDERQLRYHTERVKWDILVAAGGYNAAAVGDIEIKKYADLVFDFDEDGTLLSCAWVAGYNPKKLRERSRWGMTNTVESKPD